jgi:hypothetical protein
MKAPYELRVIARLIEAPVEGIHDIFLEDNTVVVLFYWGNKIL